MSDHLKVLKTILAKFRTNPDPLYQEILPRIVALLDEGDEGDEGQETEPQPAYLPIRYATAKLIETLIARLLQQQLQANPQTPDPDLSTALILLSQDLYGAIPMIEEPPAAIPAGGSLPGAPTKAKP